jgi:GYF domain
MENWRKGTRDENGAATSGGTVANEVDWRSSSNGTREKWARSTSWRDGDTSDAQQQQSSASPPSINQSKPSVPYKKSWGEEDHQLPEWATESFDYGGTFDSSGAFHDTTKDDIKKEVEQKQQTAVDEDPEISSEITNNDPPEPQKFVDYNGGASIDRMKEVADLVANLIMEDDPKDVKVTPALPPPSLTDWFYLDPQGDTQGPFTAQDMSEWYKAGYFQESLMVRRSIDVVFIPLGQLVKVYGRTAPFMQPQMMEPPNPSTFIFEKPQVNIRMRS